MQGHEAAEKACADLTSAKNDLEEAWKVRPALQLPFFNLHTHTLTPHPCPAHCQAVRELADDTEDDAWESKVKDRSKHSLLPTFTCVPVRCNAFCVILLQDLANTYLAFVSKEERHASFYTVLGALNCARSSPWVAPNLWPRND